MMILAEWLLKLRVGSGVAVVCPGCAEPSSAPPALQSLLGRRAGLPSASGPAAQLLCAHTTRNENSARIMPAGHCFFTYPNIHSEFFVYIFLL